MKPESEAARNIAVVRAYYAAIVHEAPAWIGSGGSRPRSSRRSSRTGGRLASAVGPFKAGAELRTRFAQVLELRDGKIVALRNYDCFYPWD